MQYQISPSVLQGKASVPPSKSHSMRAILFASLAHGKSHIHAPLCSPDRDAMVNACQALGAVIHETAFGLEIEGVKGQPQVPSQVIDVGNSGQVLRFIGAIAALLPGYTILTGDESIRSRRPASPLLAGIEGLGGFAVSSRSNGQAPLIIKGPIRPGQTTLIGQDSQPVSGLLIAASFLKGETHIQVKEPGELPWVALTLDWLRRLGIDCTSAPDYTAFYLKGHAAYEGFEYTVPGDFSAAAFPIVAALITRSPIQILGLDEHDIQGDKHLLPLLERMGAAFEWEAGVLKVKPAKVYKGQTMDVNQVIDALPILAVMGCYCEGETRLLGAEIARFKESDRISVMCESLRKMGAKIEVLPDGLCIQGGPLKSASLNSHQDHRIAMALSVAALGASGHTIVHDTQCVDKSFPNFVQVMQSLHADIKQVS